MPRLDCGLLTEFMFQNFVQGKSNELAFAAAKQVALKPGLAYNPLLLCGGTGLGKTHLLHAVGNLIQEENPSARVLYLSSERFFREMIQALRRDNIERFKQHYRTADALLIDDIQFFAGKDRTQEELFHTFNALLDSKKQIILTCDRNPKGVEGLEANLRSRFGSGLTVVIEPPDFETRFAILINKAKKHGVILDEAVACLIAKRVCSNVRDLEGVLNTLCANARFSGRNITECFAQEVLHDLLLEHDRLAPAEENEQTED